MCNYNNNHLKERRLTDRQTMKYDFGSHHGYFIYTRNAMYITCLFIKTNFESIDQLLQGEYYKNVKTKYMNSQKSVQGKILTTEHDDRLQVKNVVFHSCKDALSVLEKPSESFEGK